MALTTIETISKSALNSDGIPFMIRNGTGRGVSVSVYTDNGLNRTSDGMTKASATEGVTCLLQAGAQVFVANGIHNKTLIRDNDLIAEGSFNWFSAVRTKGAAHQREERTMVVEGRQAEKMIQDEVGALAASGAEDIQRPRWEQDKSAPRIVISKPSNTGNIIVATIVAAVAVIGLALWFTGKFFLGYGFIAFFVVVGALALSNAIQKKAINRPAEDKELPLGLGKLTEDDSLIGISSGSTGIDGLFGPIGSNRPD